MSNAAKPPKSPLVRLVLSVLGWIGKQFHKPSLPPGRLETSTGKATLWRITSNEPGVCDCWWLVHSDATSDLVISLISLMQLREDLAMRRGHGYRRETDPVRINTPNFADELEGYLEGHGGLDKRMISHIFVVAWRSRVPSRKKGKDGVERRAYLVRPVVAIPGDMQGGSIGWTGSDRYAIRITSIIAKRLMRIETELNTWEEIVNAINWLEWLEFYCSKAFGSSHVLQPRTQKR